MPIRHADDFIILVATNIADHDQSRELVEQDKSKLEAELRDRLGLTL